MQDNSDILQYFPHPVNISDYDNLKNANSTGEIQKNIELEFHGNNLKHPPLPEVTSILYQQSRAI